MRKEFILGSSAITIAIIILASKVNPLFWWLFVIVGPIIIVGICDLVQTKHSIRRIFPVLGHFRYLLEEIRPEINQYFIESNHDGTPLNREQRSLVYQRSKGVLDTIPFGTQHDVYKNGYEWLSHSIAPKEVDPEHLRVTIGGKDCLHPYSASLLNISAMSYGSLSKTAVMALNGGAKKGDFLHNTGEGGISPYHLEYEADLVWQIGTGYFGCRDQEGNFCPNAFSKKAAHPNVKMIELKLSQGAKPGHGGILPGAKVTEEIAQIRDVPIGEDVLSPPGHNTFSTPMELIEFIRRLRSLSNGKPVGFKLSLGNRYEFMAICKAMVKTGITPDFITVDGGEGGTGAAPLEFTNSLGEPGVEALIFVHNMLRGFGLREEVKIIATGKITNSFDMIKRLALGADLFYSARAMMLAIGCIQALRCNSNFCPSGVATQDPNLYNGLVVEDKKDRVYNFHKNTIRSVAEMMGAMGLDSTGELRPWHVKRRINLTDIKTYFHLYKFVENGEMLNEATIPKEYLLGYMLADPNSFEAKEQECLEKLAAATSDLSPNIIQA